jgi:diguanylate cyclase (GGDEF)-like protein
MIFPGSKSNHKILLKEHLEEIFNDEIKKARLNRIPLSLIILDFSKIRGEEIVKKIAQMLKSKTRSTDIIGRSKVKELTIIVPDIDKKRAILLVNRLKQSLSSLGEEEESKINIGFSSFPEDGTTKKELLDKAFYNLYRNRISGI